MGDCHVLAVRNNVAVNIYESVLCGHMCSLSSDVHLRADWTICASCLTNHSSDYLFDFIVFLFMYNVSAFFLKISLIIITIIYVCARVHACTHHSPHGVHVKVREQLRGVIPLHRPLCSRDGTQDARLVWQTVHPPNCLAGHRCLDFFTNPQTLVTQVPFLVDVKWHCGFDF